MSIGIGFAIGVLAGAADSGSEQHAASTPSDAAAEPAIHVEDVERFFRVYDAAGGHPTAEQLQREYIDPGTEGLHRFARLRGISGKRIAETLARRPEIYSNARRCMVVLPRVRERLAAALRTLGRLYPQARFPPVTIAEGSLMEGAAEFTAELIASKVAYAHLSASTRGREKEIETTFAADVDKTDLSDWLYNTTPEAPGDLGYWVGYRIVKAYYQRASDKRQALRAIPEMTDLKAFLAASGWYPGIQLQESALPPQSSTPTRSPLEGT